MRTTRTPLELIARINLFILQLEGKYGNPNLSYSCQKLYKRYRINMLDYSSTSVYGFIDMEGNLYKAASWDTPAKGVRGNIFNENMLQGCNKYGLEYFKPGRKPFNT